MRAGAAKGPTFAAALVVGGRYLCARVACELGLVGLGWFGLVRVGLGWVVGLLSRGWIRCVVV